MTNGITLSAREATVVLEVFTQLQRKPYRELNTFLGSLTIKDMNDLAHKLEYTDYMIKHHIADIDDMTDDDYMTAYFEKYDR